MKFTVKAYNKAIREKDLETLKKLEKIVKEDKTLNKVN